VADAQGGGGWAAVGALAAQHVLHHVQAGELVGGGQIGAVGDVVGVAGEGVEGVHVRAQAPRDQPGANREILVAAVLAGGRLDRGCRGAHV
jgi:hypothetical protein